MRGAVGAVDIVVSYFHTGAEVQELDRFGVHPSWMGCCTSFPRLRGHLRDRISDAIRPKDRVLTLFGADFNWAPQDVDRRSKSDMNKSGGRPGVDERHFRTVICQKHGFVELHQSEMTHSNASSLSRLDRF